MDLENGSIYQDPGSSKNHKSNLPFIRNSFSSLTKVFDLRQFSLNRTDEDLFKNNQRMQNSLQLRKEIDTIKNKLILNFLPILVIRKEILKQNLS